MNDTTLPVLQDIQSRQQHLDKQHLELLAQIRQNTEKLKELSTKLSEITSDHGEIKRQAAESVQLPNQHEAKLQELEARMRTCEGAIGAPAHPAPQPPPVESAPEGLEFVPEEEHTKPKHKAHHR
jgi:chromosome segregation ATPase